MQLPLHTTQRWLGRKRGAFRPVVVTSEAGPNKGGALVPHTAQGHRIQGLDLAGVIALLRVLEARA